MVPMVTVASCQQSMRHPVLEEDVPNRCAGIKTEHAPSLSQAKVASPRLSNTSYDCMPSPWSEVVAHKNTNSIAGDRVYASMAVEHNLSTGSSPSIRVSRQSGTSIFAPVASTSTTTSSAYCLCIGSRYIFPPNHAPLDLIFFRRIFSTLHRRYGNEFGEVPVLIFQRSVVRLFQVLGIKSEFNAEEYDSDGSGAVGWCEFVSCWRRSHVAVNLTVAERVFLAMEDPGCCVIGQLISGVLTSLIFISCICFVLGTLPQFRQSTEGCPQCEPEQLQVFRRAEEGCIYIFTTELMIRFLVCPFARNELLDFEKILEFVTEHGAVSIPSAPVRVLRFLTQPMNIIDMCVIFPFYFELVLATESSSNLTVLRVVRLARLFRLIKLGRYFEVLQIVGRVIHKSLRALYVLFVYLVLGVCFASAAIYYVEAGTWDGEAQAYLRTSHDGELDVSPFRSIPHVFWFSIVTFTTVGYGDISPVTTLGKLLACATMLCGILVLAMPISVISLNFGEVWSEWLEEQRLAAEAREQDILVVASALESLESRERIRITLFDEQPGQAEHELLGIGNIQPLPLDATEEIHSEEAVLIRSAGNGSGAAKKSGVESDPIMLHMSYTWKPLQNDGKNLDHIQGALDVCVHRAEGLPRSDWKTLGHRDLYVVVHCWSKPPTSLPNGVTYEQFRTRTVASSLSPVWEETAHFNFDWPPETKPNAQQVKEVEQEFPDRAISTSSFASFARSPSRGSKSRSCRVFPCPSDSSEPAGQGTASADSMLQLHAPQSHQREANLLSGGSTVFPSESPTSKLPSAEGPFQKLVSVVEAQRLEIERIGGNVDCLSSRVDEIHSLVSRLVSFCETQPRNNDASSEGNLLK